ncbi:MAG: hypothetical protein JW723_02080 [Bacteroidales bacterium]|nr:hypothetical protein [Bacteroidales bacterium]
MKLLTRCLFLLLIIIPHSVLGQKETKHLFGKDRPAEWSLFIAPEVRYSSLFNTGVVYGGVKGALLFDHHYAFGFSVGGFLTEALTEAPGTTGEIVGLNEVMIYGGFYFDYVTTFNSPVQISFPTLIGGGGILLLEKTEPNPVSGIVDEKLVEGGIYFVVEPAINMEINLTRVIRIGLGGGYRFIVNSDLERFTDKDLAAPFVNMNIKFGIY